MSEHEKCVCGEYAMLSPGFDVDKPYNVECVVCMASTPCYTTEAEAVSAWNTMQRALKSGWSSEVPPKD